ncbi:MAG: accessory gene regulator B family protein [Eubacteriales bacterium]
MFSTKLDNLANMIIESEKNTVADKEIIVYGLKTAMAQMLGIITAVALGCLFELLWESLVFLISFSCIRKYVGGYHCKKAIHCYVMSSGIMVLVLFLVLMTPDWYMSPASLLILAVSIPVILKFAPIGATNKPLDEVEKQHYRKMTLRNLTMECFITVSLLLVGLDHFAYMISLGIALTAGVVVFQEISNKI